MPGELGLLFKEERFGRGGGWGGFAEGDGDGERGGTETDAEEVEELV